MSFGLCRTLNRALALKRSMVHWQSNLLVYKEAIGTDRLQPWYFTSRRGAAAGSAEWSSGDLCWVPSPYMRINPVASRYRDSPSAGAAGSALGPTGTVL